MSDQNVEEQEVAEDTLAENDGLPDESEVPDITATDNSSTPRISGEKAGSEVQASWNGARQSGNGYQTGRESSAMVRDESMSQSQDPNGPRESSDPWGFLFDDDDDDLDFQDDVSFYDNSDDYDLGPVRTIHDDQEDTIRPDKPDEEEKAEEESAKSEGPKKKEGPIEMGKRSFRWFERKILAFQVTPKEENLRRRQLLEKCQLVRKVSKPVVTLFDIKTKSSMDQPRETDSNPSLVDSQGTGEEEKADEDTLKTPSHESKSFPAYSDSQWAMKNTIDYLTTQGCGSSGSSQSHQYGASLKAALAEANDFRLKEYKNRLKRRRVAVGDDSAAPEITENVRRHAERAMWRAVVNNTKPRYPLPRFILPRHRYLKKVQSTFLGPGSYEFDIYEKQMQLKRYRLPSTWSGCSTRFPKETGIEGVAAAGAKIIDPWTTLDAANYRYKNPGNYVPFESTPKNFRAFIERGSKIPPGAYKTQSPMEEFLKKRISSRGPYDCYTPSRSVIPYGYFKTHETEDHSRLGPGTYEVRTSLVKEMNDSYNFFKSVFAKADRQKMFGFRAAFNNPLFPPKNDFRPGVGRYNPALDSIGEDHEQEFVPFKTQVGLKTKDKKRELVAPDYYYYGVGTTWQQPLWGVSCESVFRSKTPKTMTQKDYQVRKERNKATKKTLDLDGMAAGYLPEEHWSLDPSFKHSYALEDCKDECLKVKGGPKVDPYAVPSMGLGAARLRRGGGCGC